MAAQAIANAQRLDRERARGFHSAVDYLVPLMAHEIRQPAVRLGQILEKLSDGNSTPVSKTLREEGLALLRAAELCEPW